ncbi:hypothetical protein DFP94_102242 [Fontibacillus phaseoli]|uniref:Uncharacterized protein n=1 Tax=Fontibacillus phaseoli TaxID=1416533 RepID=A0A369BIS3_9BACL|nr:hypothetical protein [Fontibacillus phaseoli]RCX21489.1 hypothetical protein DFP94_102242 [Fontibacillus phaseoli]
MKARCSMRKMLVLICSIALVLSTVSGCGRSEETRADNNEDTLIPFEDIETKFENLKSGYLQIDQDKVSFQEVVFEYDDKAIIQVKEYIDQDFVEYDLSNELEIYLIEFDEFTTKYKNVDYEFFSTNFTEFSSKPFYVEIINSKLSAIVERYVP